jgi:hypothetical protein
MLTGAFKKTILVSLLGHLTVFSLIGFSFGINLPRINVADVYFLKGMAPDINPTHAGSFNGPGIREFLSKKIAVLALREGKKALPAIPGGYLKPRASLSFNEEKSATEPRIQWLTSLKKRESVIMFHPQIPYHVTLYFKDRQVVHIELMFNVASSGNTSSIRIKRKISSGNLEADLLSMRYISRYLFMQRLGFSPHSWQTVKIDLSTK